MSAPVKRRPPVAATTEGQPIAVGASGNPPFAYRGATSKPGPALSAKGRLGHTAPPTAAFRSLTGRVWRYTGKRARVLAMLATMPGGVTQWDTLPWHTRLGGTIHALRRDGLAIHTEREGDYRHARYRLATPGSLIMQAENRRRAT